MEKQAVKAIIEKLLKLQERDREIAVQQQAIDQFPDRKKDIAARMAQTRMLVETLKTQLQAQQTAIKQLELEIESGKQEVRKLREQQYQIKSNVEFRALNNEIALHQEKTRQLEDQAIALMEQGEKSQTDLDKQQAAAEIIFNKLQDELKELEQQRQQWKDEIEQLRAARKEAAQAIDQNWIARYDRVLENKKDYALSAIRKDTCGQCHMKLPPQVLHDTRKAQDIITCSFCGRLLHWTGQPV